MYVDKFRHKTRLAKLVGLSKPKKLNEIDFVTFAFFCADGLFLRSTEGSAQKITKVTKDWIQIPDLFASFVTFCSNLLGVLLSQCGATLLTCFLFVPS